MTNEKKSYLIGLDIGTTSVGYSVVESNNQKVMRKGGKKLWGVRLFEEAESAASRRSFRSSRRRYDRRRERIHLLQEEFKDEINKVDDTFFQKLKESFYHENDKENKKNPLTKEEKEQVVLYYEKYPTIYHLRQHLMETQEKEDIRLIYLACHHMIKYRGNFLYQGDNFNPDHLNLTDAIKELFFSLLNTPIELDEENLSHFDYEALEQIILISSKNDRKIELTKSLSSTFPKNFVAEFVKFINGNKFNFTKMIEDENKEKVELSFESSEYEDKYDEYESILGDSIELLEQLKNLYSMISLRRIFKGRKSQNLSGVMVEKYEIHKNDLRFLKDLFDYDRCLYNKVFRNGKDDCLYEKYIHNHLTNTEFIKEIQKLLPSLFEQSVKEELRDRYTTEMKDRMENGDFLPRITDSENGIFPYQLNKIELTKIIENQGKYYPFLQNKIGQTYKIVKLLEFRIPYYVGPLVKEENSPFAWMIRKKEGEKITPYNFDEIIDKEQTAEKFIKRMISHCTYLLNEYAIPNNSILYSKFKVMNELKQIKVNGEKLDNAVQQKIIKELFLTTKGNITDKKFKEYLYKSPDFDMYNDNIEVTGYSSENGFANNMSSYVDFFLADGIFDGTSYKIEDAEQIIEWVTIFEDKDILEKKVRDTYTELNDKKVKEILSKKYKGWSSLSKKLLTEKYYEDKESGLKKSIMDLMEETELNFMQIINEKKYKFDEMIKEYNELDEKKKLNYSVVENLATSPATKRGIYQALKVVDELVTYIGYDPEMIVIEMARENGKKERTTDRKKYLTKIYQENKKEMENYQKLMKELNQFEKIDSEKLFLYFLQQGKSLYSATPLDINHLDQYEVDHIIPRTLIKDDSLDNKALVLKEENQIKAANFVLPREFRTDYMKTWWAHLKKMNLISNKKFYSLTRSKYKDEDIAGFINRQLVETRQITKHVANILGSFYSDSKIVYLKANLSHNYRECYELYKFRDINDYHHAHDAYLAAVLGEYKEKYLKKNISFDKVKELNHELFENKEYKKLKYGYVINSLNPSTYQLIDTMVDQETGEVLFDANEFNKRVEDALYNNDILISKKTEIRSGEFYNQTKNKKGFSGVSLKGNLPTNLYGSYTSLNPAYAVLVQYTKKKKEYQQLIGIPIYIIEKEKSDKTVKDAYVRNLLQLTKEDTLIIGEKKIPFYSLFDWEGQICYLVGASDKIEVCNAKEFFFDKNFMKEKKESFYKLLNNTKREVDNKKYEEDLTLILKYIVDKMEQEYLLYQNLIPKLKNMIHYDDMTVLSIEEKETVIKELLNLLKCNSRNANFKFLNSNYSSAFGKKHGRTISHARIKNKSVTGIKEDTYEF